MKHSVLSKFWVDRRDMRTGPALGNVRTEGIISHRVLGAGVHHPQDEAQQHQRCGKQAEEFC